MNWVPFFRRNHSRIFTCGNRAGRSCWSAGLFGDLLFHHPLHSGSAPYSPNFTLISSQFIDVTIGADYLQKLERCKPCRPHSVVVMPSVCTDRSSP
ncbi:hypothetical protein PR048_019964 [Dryococelus australis]|uniref:Uncharacterized protein n=1 Tax=Dryococelus australis TaxID=614101 RepID=A0ABQ9H501_9NEOP|nr:hypothetical protein PR048_019964 [Dryococelus australis]